MADGHVDGDNLICGVHGWDCRYDTGVSEYNNKEKLHKFYSEIKDKWVWIDEEEIKQFLQDHPQPFDRNQYLGAYSDTHPEETEPFTNYIKELAQNGLKNYNMKKILLFTTITICSFQTFSQESFSLNTFAEGEFGLRAGFKLASMSGFDDDNIDKRFAKGDFFIGLVSFIEFTEKVDMLAEIA